MCTTLVNTYEVEHLDISDDLSLSQVEVTVPTTSTFLYFVINFCCQRTSRVLITVIFFKGKLAI